MITSRTARNGNGFVLNLTRFFYKAKKLRTCLEHDKAFENKNINIKIIRQIKT